MRLCRLSPAAALFFLSRRVCTTTLTTEFVEATKVTMNPAPALLHDSIASTIGATPLVKLNKLAPPGVDIFVKMEAFNPMGSVKDRVALGMIEYAEQHGLLKPGQTVVEATSGNTGLGLAMVCAAKGYPFVCVMSEAFSIERRKMMRFLGAKVILTNPAHKFGGMLQTLMALKEQHGWYWPNQFENEANAWIHRSTTGPELVRAMEGRSFDYFVCGELLWEHSAGAQWPLRRVSRSAHTAISALLFLDLPNLTSQRTRSSSLTAP